MNAIKSQTTMLRTSYIYLAVFLLACLTGLFFGFSGAIDDVAQGYTVKGFEPVEQNAFTGVFYDYDIISLVLRIFMLAGIAVFMLNITNVKKFIPALILTLIVAANPFFIAVFKVQVAFAIMPAMFFGLLAIVIAKNIKTNLKYLSYAAVLVSALYMLSVAIAASFLVLMYQMLPVDVTPETKPTKRRRRFEFIAFIVFFALLITEQMLLGDYLRLSLDSGNGFFGNIILTGGSAIFFFFPFVERLLVYQLGLACFIPAIIGIALLITSAQLFTDEKKLRNMREKLTVLYWSLGLLIFLLFSALLPELSLRISGSGLFISIAIVIAFYTLISVMKFKLKMVFGFITSAFAILVVLTSVFTQGAWADKETLMRKVVDHEGIGRYAKAQLAEILYEKAQKTNNPQRFDEYHKEFKELCTKYMENPFVGAEYAEDSPVNTAKFAELDLIFDINEFTRLWDVETRRAALNLPFSEAQKTSISMLKTANLFAKHAELVESLEKKIADLKKFSGSSKNKIDEEIKWSYSIDAVYYNALISMLPNELETPRLDAKFLENDEPSGFALFPNLSESALQMLAVLTVQNKISELDYSVFSRFLNTLIVQNLIRQDVMIKLTENLAAKRDSDENNIEILKTIEKADLLLLRNDDSQDAITEVGKISLELMNFAVKGVSPYIQAEILLRRGLLFQFVQQLPEDANNVYDEIINLSRRTDYNNPALISHVLYLKALIQHDAGNLKQSLPLLNQAIDLDKDNYVAQILRGNIRFVGARQKLDELIVSFTKEYRALPEDKQKSVVERSKFIPIWELERAFFEENEVYSKTVQSVENNLAAAFEVDKENKQLKQTLADLLFYRGYGQRALKNTDLAELALRRSYNMYPDNPSTILGANIANVLGQFYFEVWSAYLTSETITEENQAEVNDLLARALQLSGFVRDQLYEFVQKFIEDHPDMTADKLMPFYLTAKEIYPDWVPARRWLAEFYRAAGVQDLWEEEYTALLKYTEDAEEWPTLNLECSQIYLIWASYGLRNLQKINNKDEMEERTKELQRLFEKSDEHNEIFVRFGDSEFLYWQNRSILYQRWADLLATLGNQEQWLVKVNAAIESFEHYLTLDTIDANNTALSSLYRAKFMYYWRKNQADWYEDNEKWEKTAETQEMMECMSKYKEWTLTPVKNQINKNKAELEKLNDELEGYKKSGFVKKINELVDKISELKKKNDDLIEQLAKLEKVNAWLFNYTTVLQGVNAFKAKKYDEAMKLFLTSYGTIDSAYDAFWLGRINEILGQPDTAIRWFLISATKYPHALVKITEILDDSEKSANIDVLYLRTYMTLTENLKSIEYVKTLRDDVTNKLKNSVELQDSQELKLHLAKLDNIYVQLLVEDSNASVLSFLLAQIYEIEGNYTESFKRYLNASMEPSMFYESVYRAGEAIAKSDEYKLIANKVLHLLQISLIFASQNEILENLDERTNKVLAEVENAIKNKPLTDDVIDKNMKLLEQASEGTNNPTYDYILGDILVAKKDYKKAEDKYKSASSLQLLFFPSYLAVAEMYNEIEGMKPRAYNAYQEFLDLLNQTGKDKLVVKLPEQIRANYNAILDEYNRLLKEGKSAYEAGKYKIAVQNLEECFKYDRNAATAYILAGAYRKLDDILNAESWYLTTIQSQDIILYAYYELAEMLENVPEKRWRAFWALGQLIEMTKDSEDPEVLTLAGKAKEMLVRLDDVRKLFFTQGKELLEKGEYKEAYDSFLLSYNTNESPETAYFVGKCLLDGWIKENSDKENIDPKNLTESEKWFLLAAEAENGNALGYYELATAHYMYLDNIAKAKEFYELYLEKTHELNDPDTIERRKVAKAFMEAAKSKIDNSLEEGKRLFKEGEFEQAYNSFLLNFNTKNSPEAALWVARSLEKLKRFGLAQNWYLFAADELPEAFYDLACAWYNMPVQLVRWVALKYFDTFIKVSENNKKLEDKRKDAIEKQKLLKVDFDEFTSKPVVIDSSVVIQYNWAYDNLYESGMMFYKDSEIYWLADIYLSAFIKMVKLTLIDDVLARYEDKIGTAQDIQKSLEDKYDKALDDAFKYTQEKENEKAIEAFKTVLNIKRTFPSDYSLLLALLETQKKYDELIRWSDIAVSFYADSESGMKYRLYEKYFFLNAKAHFEHGEKETGIKKLQEYTEKWKEGKFTESVKTLLESANQTKPE